VGTIQWRHNPATKERKRNCLKAGKGIYLRPWPLFFVYCKLSFGFLSFSSNSLLAAEVYCMFLPVVL
jgi:hypothetical protein